MAYTIGREDGITNYHEMEPLYREHYAEMKARLEAEGIPIGDYNPRLHEYFPAFKAGYLLNFVVRHDGTPVGYSNIYITNDMHNGELIATEDTIFVTREHRNGVGRKLAKDILAKLREINVKRFHAVTVTDPRVAKVWARMGFRYSGQSMTYVF